jgi:hypothetical protein
LNPLIHIAGFLFVCLFVCFVLIKKRGLFGLIGLEVGKPKSWWPHFVMALCHFNSSLSPQRRKQKSKQASMKEKRLGAGPRGRIPFTRAAPP